MSRSGPFLALSWRASRESSLLALTPRAMRWSEGVWLFDLGPCLEYWQDRAHRMGEDWKKQIQRAIVEAFFEEKQARLQASLAPHPWQAILLLAAMAAKKRHGIADLADSESQELYAALSWRSWFRAAMGAGPHFIAAGEPRFHRADYARGLEQMQRAMRRLSFSRPSQLKDASPAAIQRRFGPQLAKLWEWTRCKEGEIKSGSFPWLAWSPREKPSVRRDLEFPLGEWEPLAELLVEDLDRLCDLPAWTDREKLLRLHWDLEFEGAGALCVPIFFRYPHTLHAERGMHATTLVQARYGLEQAAQTILAQRRADEFRLVTLLSWRLTVEERIRPPAHSADLFGEKDREEEERKLARLANLLRVPLERYAVRPDVSYRDSFARLAQGEPFPASAASAKSWECLARQRPLYLYEKPLPVPAPPRRSAFLFLERTGRKWWRARNPLAPQRDYWALLDSQGRLLWVTQKEDGTVHAHGIFA